MEAGFPVGSEGKESPCQCRRPRFNPWVEKIPWRREWIKKEEEEEGNGYPLQYSCQENIGKGGLVGHKSIGVVKELDTTNQLTL